MLRGHAWPGRGPTKPSRSTVAVVALFAALTLAMTFPLWVHPASTRLTSGADADLVLWTLSWDAHAFLHQPAAIFDSNIYYPFRDTLAFSENQIGAAFFSAPVQWLTGNPVLALNVVSLLSCALCGIGAWVLGRQLGLGLAASILTGIVFAFSPPRFLRIEQLHLATVQWIPFGLATLHAYLDRGRARDLKLTALFFMLQVLTSGHGAVFMIVACGGLLLYRTVLGEPVRPWRWLLDLGITGALLLIPVVLTALPYRRVRAEMGFKRDLLDWIVPATSFLASPSHVDAWLAAQVPDAQILQTAEAYLFPGVLTLLLALAAVFVRPPRTLSSVADAPGSEDPGLHHEKDVGRGFSPGVGADAAAVPSRHARAAWARRVAAALEIVAAVLLAGALVLTIVRPARVRLDGLVLFTARSLWRPWLLALAAVAARAALVRRVPFSLPVRLRAGLDAWRHVQARHRTSAVGFYGTLSLFTLLLSIGPPFGIWPLVFGLPGFDTIRVPSRFTILGVLGLAVLAGIGFDRISARWWPFRGRAAAVIVSAVVLAEFLVAPLEVVPFSVDLPGIDRWVATQPAPSVIAEVPVVDPSDGLRAEGRQAIFMLHSMAHWQKTIHGYSGFRAPLHTRLYEHLWRFPTDEGLRALADVGVTRIIVHSDAYEPDEWRDVEARIGGFSDWLRLEHVDGPGRSYALRRPADR